MRRILVCLIASLAFSAAGQAWAQAWPTGAAASTAATNASTARRDEGALPAGADRERILRMLSPTVLGFLPCAGPAGSRHSGYQSRAANARDCATGPLTKRSRQVSMRAR